MCGICGFTGDARQAILVRMNESLRHRGPDDDGYFEDEWVKLAMRRLSIVDIESGKQPICNEDHAIWTVFNGEIYDHESIRRDLVARGHRFSTHHSDTEVIVHLYEEYGEDWANHVNGMFGVAIWDQKRKRLSLYRDRIGKKPLYYALKGGQIVFASEIKALFQHPAVSRELDYRALYDYFGLKNTSAPRTAYADVSQLLPGCLLTWEAGDVETRPYWKLDFGSPLEDISETEAAAHLRELLEDSVRIRMQCDAPYGAYLSGGVDSSSVASLMSRFQSRPIKTFCLGYTDEAEGQFVGKHRDIEYARAMSRRLNSEHHEYLISARDFADRMPDVLRSFDEPYSGAVSTFFMTILLTQHVKVALSGDGADELFGSYLAHRLAFPIENYLELARGSKVEWADLNEEDRERFRPFGFSDSFELLQDVASDNIAEWRSRLHVFSQAERTELLSQDFLEAAGRPAGDEPYRTLGAGLTAKDALNRSLEIDQKELLPNQVLPFVDRLSMAFSVEVRCPYLDYRIIEFANRLPGRMKIRRGENKYVHRLSIEDLIPDEIVNRPKEGFVQPIYSWMHGKLKDWTLEQIAGLPKSLFNRDALERHAQKFEGGDQSENARIWNLVCFSIWHREVCSDR